MSTKLITTKNLGQYLGAAEGSAATRDAAYRPFHSALIANSGYAYVIGHSVVSGFSSSWPGGAFTYRLQEAIHARAAGVSLISYGLPGGTSAAIRAHFDAEAPFSVYTPLLVLMVLVNDREQGVEPSVSRANLTALIARVRAMQPAGNPPPGVLIALEWDSDLTTAAHPWSAYAAAARDVAAADPMVTLLDLGARLGPVKNSQGGIFADFVHPTDVGHALISQYIAAEILPA